MVANECSNLVLLHEYHMFMQSTFRYVSKQQSNAISFSSEQLKTVFVESFYFKKRHIELLLLCFHL